MFFYFRSLPTRAQRDDFVQRFNKLAGSLKDIHGNKIFTTYKGGEDLRLANGENLPESPLKFDSEVGENTAELESLRKKFQGTDKWLKAPNGKNTNLTEKQWLTVRTKAFKRWFGDWENDAQNSSQVVDENGEPLVVYHGARKAGFSIFNDTEGKKQSDAPEGSSFFSNSRELARSYSGTDNLVGEYGEDAFEESNGGNYACFLNIREPFVDDFEGSDWQGDAYGKFQILDEDDIPVYNQKGGELFDSEEEAEKYAQELELENYSINADPWIGKSTNSVVREVMQGEYGDDYDGVVIQNVVDSGGRMDMYDPATEYIIFNSNQVKSATDNIGEFSPFDDDIRFSYSGTKTKNSVDNETQKADNIEGRAKRFFDKYLTEGIMKSVRQSVSDEIGKYVDFKELKNLEDFDKARDELPYINEMLVHYNDKTVQGRSAYKDRLSSKIEYARRCFENDPRIQREVDKKMDADRRQGGVYPTGNADFQLGQGRGRTNGERTGTGTATPVSHEFGNSKEHFKKLWDNFDETKAKPKVSESSQHSEKNQGAFSFEEKVQSALKKDPSVKNLIENLGGKFVNGKLVADKKTRAKIESQLDNGKIKYSVAWHGTPHDFENFSLDEIGTGEGAQVHGWGLFFAENREVSEDYKKTLAGRKGTEGKLFKVDIPDKEFLLDEGKRWRNQPKKVKDGIKKLVSELSDDEIGIENRETILDGIMNDPVGRGGFIYSRLSSILGGDKTTSERLNKYGIKGITYEGERDGRCYVIFDDKAIKILEKFNLNGTGDTTLKNFVAAKI